MTHSLRGRLFIGLTLIIVITGFGAGTLAFRWAFREAIEMQDAILTQIGAVALNTRFQNDASLNHDVDAEARVIIEELSDRPGGTPDARSLWALRDGLHVASRDQESWRVLLKTRTDGSRFAVGQPTAIRDEIARDNALHTILPFAVLMPCLMFVIAIVIWQSMKPMIKLAEHLDARRSDDLNKLPLEGTPRELHPFITSINRLFDRIHAMMDQQRRFIADAAHELRTPITALSLQAENLDQIGLPSDSRERLAALKKGMGRTKHLLDQLLTLARYDVSRPSENVITNLERCAKDVVVDLLPEAASRGIDLGFDVIESVSVRGEPAMLAAVIRNLANNSLQATPRGGRIDIEIRGDGIKAVIEIRDTGPGIPPSDLDRIFEPFFRGSRPATDGTGLGLSIVKRIVDQIGGSITLKNIAGNGHTGLCAVVRVPQQACE